MDRDLCLTLISEIEKLRKDLDKCQAYQKTMAEQLEAPADGRQRPADDVDDYIFCGEQEWLASDR